MSLANRRANLIAAAFLLGVGVIAFVQLGALDATAEGSDPGAAGYPRLIAGAIIVLAVLLALQEDNGEPPITVADALRVAATIGLIIGYVVLIDPLGYILATALFLVAAMLLMGIRSVIGLIVLPVGLSLVNFYVFSVAFGVPLPMAFLERWLS